MPQTLGLRERKKLRTREAIIEAATALLIERGFEQVSVADIAAAADVSKMTVFNYFQTKEDIILCQIDDHAAEAASVVRARPAGQSPLAALHEHFVQRLRDHDPATGLADDPHFIAFQHLVTSTPSLMLRLMDQLMLSESTLATAFAEVLEDGDELTATVAACQVINVQRVLVTHNLRRILDGAALSELTGTAADEADRAFGILERGFRDTPLGTADTRRRPRRS